MEQNEFGKRIEVYRKERSMTQEAVATELGLTAQAVSKWETGQSFPDITLLPRLADLFAVSIDALFGRAAQSFAEAPSIELPWNGDEHTLHVVLFAGHKLVGSQEVTNWPQHKKLQFEYEGPALNIQSAISVGCGNVQGNVTAQGSVNCDAVGGNVSTQGSVSCDDVHGSVNCGGSVTADDIGGDVNAGGSVTADDIAGSVKAGSSVTADSIGGTAAGNGRSSTFFWR